MNNQTFEQWAEKGGWKRGYKNPDTWWRGINAKTEKELYRLYLKDMGQKLAQTPNAISNLP